MTSLGNFSGSRLEKIGSVFAGGRFPARPGTGKRTCDNQEGDLVGISRPCCFRSYLARIEEVGSRKGRKRLMTHRRTWLLKRYGVGGDRVRWQVFKRGGSLVLQNKGVFLKEC